VEKHTSFFFGGKTMKKSILAVFAASAALALLACSGSSNGNDDMSFAAKAKKSSFKDARDGKKYKSVEIGDQVWMAENLNYAVKGSKCVVMEGLYKNSLTDANTEYCNTYGRLYKWEAAMGALESSDRNPSNVQGVCPDGWHLPSNAEWAKLIDFVGAATAGAKLKDMSIYGGTDDYGFSALLGGAGNSLYNDISFLGDGGLWWSTTQSDSDTARAYARFIYSTKDSVYISAEYKDVYLGIATYAGGTLDALSSVRCVKGQGVPPTICNDKYYNPATHFCYGGKEIYALHNGKEYEPATCGKEIYNPETHFCNKSENNPAIFEKCGGKDYNTKTEVCVNGEVQNELAKFKDARDGKEYKYTTIGTQTWMAENLNYATAGSRCLDDKQANCDKYGRLYDYEAALPGCGSGKNCSITEKGLEPQGVCPDGWYLPTSEDWFILRDFAGAGDREVAGKKLRANDYGGTDNYGFSVLKPSNFSIQKPSNDGYPRFWSSDVASTTHGGDMEIYIVGDMEGVQILGAYKTSFLSVRCLKSTLPKCGNKGYNPKTHFCTESESNPELLPFCGGQSYDTRTKFCKDGVVQDKPSAPIKQTFKDARDGKTYKYVEIGTQTWMAENLNYKAEGSVCYDNEEANCDTYGRLYTWRTREYVCPAGWHLPNDAEWNTLADVVGGVFSEGSGGKLKAIGNLWYTTENLTDRVGIAGTDDYGFSALPGGYYETAVGGKSGFNNLGRDGSWWTIEINSGNSVFHWYLGYNTSSFMRGANWNTILRSVRCVKDSVVF
jgi:uncharacterized protein (TIGR02145 family)